VTLKRASKLAAKIVQNRQEFTREPNYRFERAERDRTKKGQKRQEAAATTAKGGASRRQRHPRTDRGERAARNLIGARPYRVPAALISLAAFG